jgi:hypothetical protein
MSLQALADQMKSRGRGGDTELVHMTKGEVAGLQQLAMAAGGSLTINPDTGLPEASFLRNLLPTIIGFGLAPFTGGLSAAAIGAGTGAMLNKENPLMGAITGGLGAFGGAQLGAGLSAAGTTAAQAAAVPGAQAAGQAAVDASVRDLAARQAMAEGAKVGGAEAAQMAIQGQALPAVDLAAPSLDAVRNQAMGNYYMSATPGGYPAMYQGIGALTEQPGRAAFMDAVGGGKGLVRSGMMAASPMAMAMSGRQRPVTEEGDTEDIMGRYTYDSGFTGGDRTPGSAYTSERRFFNPRYIRNAQGGEVKKYADGGEMSAPSSDPARGMTGASADAMRYLYGMQDQSPALQARLMAAEQLKAAPIQAPAAAPKLDPRMSGVDLLRNPASMVSLFMGQAGLLPQSDAGPLYRQVEAGYTFDPQSQTYSKKYEYQPYVPESRSPFNFGNDSSAAAGGEVYSDGIASLARGGMKAGGFVVPADVVSMVGEGNTDAGYERIRRMIPGATAIKGKDGGQADTVATSIEGKQPARVAHGEMYVPPAAVKRAGGAKKLYAMMKSVRKQAKGDAKQIKPVDLKKAMA